MLVKDHPPEDPTSRPLDEPGPSAAPPPTFEESAGHILIDFDQTDAVIPAGGEDPPPAFTPYTAEFFVSNDGAIITHDPHLNEDGEALYRFLLTMSLTYPTYALHCQGTHVEHRTRLVSTTDSNGHRQTKTERYTETIADFDFSIDVAQTIASKPTQWTVGDEEPAYRGRMVREVGIPGFTRKALRDEIKEAKAWRAERSAQGLPPWITRGNVRLPTEGMEMPLMRDVTKSSWTLRQWADDYCASSKHLKEFIYYKVTYGWNVESLTAAVRSAILSTHYTGDISIEFKSSMDRLIVRPDTRLSRALSNHWLKLLLMITLIYPFIWLFRRFHARGGGLWAVGGAAFPLKKWEPTQGGAGIAELRAKHPKQRYTETSAGVQILAGAREGEWFQRWEGTIRRAVAAKKVDQVPMREPDDVPDYNIQALDGYSG